MTFKFIFLFLAVLGGYYLYSTNFMPSDFFRDTKKIVEYNFGSIDTQEIKEKAKDKLSQVIEENKEEAKEVIEEKMKEVVDEAVDSAVNKATLGIANQLEENNNNIIINQNNKIQGCKQGYYFSKIFTAVCVQVDCEEYEGAKLDEQGRCICENDRQALYREISDKDCPGCLYECEK